MWVHSADKDYLVFATSCVKGVHYPVCVHAHKRFVVPFMQVNNPGLTNNHHVLCNKLKPANLG